MHLDSLNDVLREELADLYSAEQQLVAALPKMAAAAHSKELRKAFEDHLAETRTHVQRLEQAFGELDGAIPKETCDAMKGLIKEGSEVVEATGDAVARDVALIGAAQRVEHYEIAGYGTAKAIAGELGLDKVSSLLDETLSEEGKADKLLTKIATGGLIGSGVNQDATVRS
jgi:ferritin-like metal-binding protein YciE